MFRSTGVMNTPAGGSNSLTDKLSEYKWSIVGVIALIGVALILYFYVFKPMSTTPVTYSANAEHDTYSSRNGKEAEIMFFYFQPILFLISTTFETYSLLQLLFYVIVLV